MRHDGDLDRSECLSRLGGGAIGRVVFTDAALPAAQPVAYLLDDEEILFLIGEGSHVPATLREAVLAFQSDDIDRTTHAGWTVLGVGQAYEVTDSPRLVDLAVRFRTPLVGSGRMTVVAIPLTQLTGRQLVVGEDI